MSENPIQKHYPPLNNLNFNRKSFQKEIKQHFQYVRTMSKFGLTGTGNEFDKSSKSINKSLTNIFTKDGTFQNGNIYFVLTIINNHIEFLKTEVKRFLNTVISLETIKQIQTDIISQHEEISKALLDNIENPVSYDTLADSLGLDLDKLGEEDGK